MSNIIKKVPQALVPYDEFSKAYDSLSNGSTFLEKGSDLYSKIPSLIRSLASVEPTGVLEYLTGLLESNKEKREDEALKKALYCLYVAIIELGEKVKLINQDKSAVLFEDYLSKSKRSDLNKIEYLKNAFLHGICNRETTVNEDQNMLELINQLSMTQLNILLLFKNKQASIDYDNLRSSKEHQLNYKTIAASLSIDEPIAKRNCMDLIGKGILEDWGVGRLDYKGPGDYIINEYTKMVFEYALDVNI